MGFIMYRPRKREIISNENFFRIGDPGTDLRVLCIYLFFSWNPRVRFLVASERRVEIASNHLQACARIWLSCCEPYLVEYSKKHRNSMFF